MSEPSIETLNERLRGKLVRIHHPECVEEGDELIGLVTRISEYSSTHPDRMHVTVEQPGGMSDTYWCFRSMATDDWHLDTLEENCGRT